MFPEIWMPNELVRVTLIFWLNTCMVDLKTFRICWRKQDHFQIETLLRSKIFKVTEYAFFIHPKNSNVIYSNGKAREILTAIMLNNCHIKIISSFRFFYYIIGQNEAILFALHNSGTVKLKFHWNRGYSALNFHLYHKFS